MKKINILLAFIAILITQSCAKDFLDVDSTEVIIEDVNNINNDEGAKALTTAVYAKFLDWNMSSFSWIGLTSITDDNADKGSDPGDTGADKQLLDALTWTSSSPSCEEVFTANYQGIGRANYALLQIPLLSNADPNLRSRLTGEVKFLRAFMYFNLVRLYGGVPLVDHVPNAALPEDNLMLVERKTAEEIYAFIIQDLTDAIAALPDRSVYPNDERARVSKGSALALMAKVQLYKENWSEVINYANQLTGYSLTTNYADIFKLEGEFNAESLFEINGYGSDPAKGIQQYAQSQGARGSGGWGWGFNTPSISLVQAYESGDARKDATIIFAGQTLYDGRVVPSTVANPRYNYKAYSSLNPGSDHNDTNIRYLRFAEVLLMKAEAYNELGNTTEAKNALNQVRNRAGLANTTANNQDDLRTAIWKERRVELAMEHDRWFDLVRTGQAYTAMQANGKNFIVGKHELFPIPQNFINQSNGVCTQNPGY